MCITMDTEKPTIRTHTITPQGEGEYTYIGFAKMGSSESAAVWRIMRVHTITPQGQGEQSTILYADGNQNYDNVWSDHATLTYA